MPLTLNIVLQIHFHVVVSVLLGVSLPEVLHSHDYLLECQWEWERIIKLQYSS